MRPSASCSSDSLKPTTTRGSRTPRSSPKRTMCTASAFRMPSLANGSRTSTGQQVRDALRHLVGRTVDVRFVTLTAASVRSDRPVAGSGGGGVSSAAPASAAQAQERPRGLRRGPAQRPLHVLDLRRGRRTTDCAHAACLAVAERPGPKLQPAFHLRRRRVSARPTSCTRSVSTSRGKRREAASRTSRARQFTNEFIDSIRTAAERRVSRALPRLDVLLIDDIQFLADKEPHAGRVLPHLQRAHRRRQADRPLERSSARRRSESRGPARSRFEWGLIADIRRRTSRPASRSCARRPRRSRWRFRRR